MMTSKHQAKQLKLPKISSKTSSSFSSQQNISNSRSRPLSSTKVNDLEHNLFSQLDEYDNLDKKSQRKIKTHKNEKLQMVSEMDAPYLKKLQKLLPSTYNKIISSVKPEPLQQTNQIKTKKRISKELQDHPKNVSSSIEIKPTSSTNLSKKGKPAKEEREMTSFDVAQREVEAIYQKYLQEEGLTELNHVYSSKDLQQLNNEINCTDNNLKELRKSFFSLINEFSISCVNDD